jgi:hypothetical protein
MHRENIFYVLGKSETQLLCYDESKDYEYEKCFHFSDSILFVEHYTLGQAKEQTEKLKKYFPDLNVYLYRVSENIGLMD